MAYVFVRLSVWFFLHSFLFEEEEKEDKLSSLFSDLFFSYVFCSARIRKGETGFDLLSLHNRLMLSFEELFHFISFLLMHELQTCLKQGLTGFRSTTDWCSHFISFVLTHELQTCLKQGLTGFRSTTDWCSLSLKNHFLKRNYFSHHAYHWYIFSHHFFLTGFHSTTDWCLLSFHFIFF